MMATESNYMRPGLALVFCIVALATSSCFDSESFEKRDLVAYPNPFGPDNSMWSEQPHREKPLEIVVGPKGERAFISLQGTPDLPGGRKYFQLKIITNSKNLISVQFF